MKPSDSRLSKIAILVFVVSFCVVVVVVAIVGRCRSSENPIKAAVIVWAWHSWAKSRERKRERAAALIECQTRRRMCHKAEIV